MEQQISSLSSSAGWSTAAWDGESQPLAAHRRVRRGGTEEIEIARVGSTIDGSPLRSRWTPRSAFGDSRTGPSSARIDKVGPFTEAPYAGAAAELQVRARGVSRVRVGFPVRGTQGGLLGGREEHKGDAACKAS
jgi:hypothetical protein